MILAILLFWTFIGVTWLIVLTLRALFLAAEFVFALIGIVIAAIYEGVTE